MNESYFLRQLWRWKCGLPDEETIITPSLESLRESEWSCDLEQLMRNRLIMGAIRYGKLHQPGKPQYDRVTSIKKRMDIYKETGNREILVDVANLCLLEFEECYHPNAHFHAIDDGEHTQPIY